MKAFKNAVLSALKSAGQVVSVLRINNIQVNVLVLRINNIQVNVSVLRINNIQVNVLVLRINK